MSQALMTAPGERKSTGFPWVGNSGPHAGRNCVLSKGKQASLHTGEQDGQAASTGKGLLGLRRLVKGSGVGMELCG